MVVVMVVLVVVVVVVVMVAAAAVQDVVVAPAVVVMIMCTSRGTGTISSNTLFIYLFQLFMLLHWLYVITSIVF